MKKLLLTTVCAAACLSGAQAATIFSENFGTLADGTILTTTNTGFTYARLSTGATPTLEAQNPGSFTGSSALLGATTTSLTGLGATALPTFTVGTLSFSLTTSAILTGTSNNFFFGVGAGTTFTGNTTFAGADLMAGYQITNGQLQVRVGPGGGASGSFTNVGTPLAASTSYDFRVIFNGSDSAVSYTGNSVAAGTTDVFLNGSLIGDDIDLTDNVDATAFRFYTTASNGLYELDNVALDNAALVPEPSTYVMLVGGLGLMALVYRRKSTAA